MLKNFLCFYILSLPLFIFGVTNTSNADRLYDFNVKIVNGKIIHEPGWKPML